MPSMQVLLTASQAVMNGKQREFEPVLNPCLQAGYARLNSVLTPGSNYVDFVVVSGQTYYYVVTAVDTTGLESEYSNQVTAVIPTP